MQKSIRKKFVLVSFTSFFILFTNFERVLASNNRSNQSSSSSTRNNSSSGGADGNGGGSSWDYYHGDSVASNKGALNPYKILGVARDATQEDIKRQYRNLCLKYHPDKNVHRSQQERDQCEYLFKQIQEANSLIGTEQDRKKYDSMSYFQRQRSQYQHASKHYEGSGTPSHSYYSPFSPNTRQYNYPYSPFYPRTAMRRRAFYVNGVDVSNLFNHGGKGAGMYPFSNHPFRESSMQDEQQQSVIPNFHKSIFVQTITVPLEDLYSGETRHTFELKDTIVHRYMAAFRGGIAAQIGLQSLLTCLPLLFRVSWVASLLGFLATFHLSLPRPSRLIYYSKLRAGWKGGTKLKFQSVEPGLDVIFVIQEGKHDRFQRDGNNLMTSINIGKSKAKNGCTLVIEPLGKDELPITVKLKPGDITKKHHTVTVIGRGWPKPGGGGAGDLIVRVNVISDTQEQRWGRRKRFPTKK